MSHIGPSQNVVSGELESDDDGMVKDLIREGQPHAILDQGVEHGHRAGIATKLDKLFHSGDLILDAINDLLARGIYVNLSSLNEATLGRLSGIG